MKFELKKMKQITDILYLKYILYLFSLATNNEPQHQLRNVALISDDHRNNFVLKSVYEDDNEIGTTNGQQWYHEDTKQQAKRRYRVEIEFHSSVQGTYR